MPLVSIIMACHNQERYVHDAITSALGQTYTDFELIFVDDHSTDKSLHFANILMGTDSRLHVFSSPCQLGAGAARNFAIKHARGEWIAVLDADDVFFKDKLEKQISAVHRHPNKESVVLVGSGVIHINSDGKRLSTYQYPTDSLKLKERLVRMQAFPAHSSLLYRSSVLRKVGGFNNIFLRAQDYDLWLRLCKEGDILCLNEPLMGYRLHNTNISNSKGKSGYSQFEYAVAANVCDMLRQNNYQDPSSLGDPLVWDSFMAHVIAQIKMSGELEYRDWKKSWSNLKFAKSGSRLKILMLFMRIIANPSNAWRLLKEHLVGTVLPRRCYLSWIDRIKN